MNKNRYPDNTEESKMNQISPVTRRDIIEALTEGFSYLESIQYRDPDYGMLERFESRETRVTYHGRLSEMEFLKRLYNLEQLPSYDSRFKNAEGDIWQHTVSNDDYEPCWIFEDDRFDLLKDNDDAILLNFLCEILHPEVRTDKENWQALLEKLNQLLKNDGYEIYPSSKMSGHDIYRWRVLNPTNGAMQKQLSKINQSFDSQYIKTQTSLMYESIESAPHLAIGKAKELMETCCKTILTEQGILYNKDISLPKLMKETCKSIGLSAEDLKRDSQSYKIAAQILGNFSNIAYGMAELRNLYGDGHGKEIDFQPLPPRYANLAVGASITAVQFLWDTYQERCSQKKK